jgi:hypothetical protein
MQIYDDNINIYAQNNQYIDYLSKEYLEKCAL